MNLIDSLYKINNNIKTNINNKNNLSTKVECNSKKVQIKMNEYPKRMHCIIKIVLLIWYQKS